jgi:hypothetical protein
MRRAFFCAAFFAAAAAPAHADQQATLTNTQTALALADMAQTCAFGPGLRNGYDMHETDPVVNLINGTDHPTCVQTLSLGVPATAVLYFLPRSKTSLRILQLLDASRAALVINNQRLMIQWRVK